MRASLGAPSLISFLDLISCGLGAALLLFVIGAAATPASPPIDEDRSVLVVSHREGGSRAEVGLQWRTPGGEWNNEDEEDTFAISVPSSSDAGGEAVLILRDPPSGSIEVRPYLRAYPALDQDVNDLSKGCRVTIEVFGMGISLRKSPPPLSMDWPGRPGQVIEIGIERSPHR